MKIERIENLDALLDFKTDWERLFEEPKTNNVFLTFEWMSLWCKYLCKEAQPLILVFKENGKSLGIAPLMIKEEKKFGLSIRKIEFLSTSDADRLDFIIPEAKEWVLKGLFRFFLEDYKEWDILEFSKILESSTTIKILEDMSTSFGLLSKKFFCFRSFYLHSDGTGVLPYFPSCKGLRKDFRKINNRLLRFGIEARMEIFSDLGSLKSLFQTLVDIENRSWKGNAKIGVFSNKERVIFHKALIESLAKKNMLEIAILKLGKDIVAYNYNFKSDSIIQSYNTAYLPEYSYLSPGAFLIYQFIENFFLNGGREIDFLSGEEPYKQRWTNQYRKHLKVRIFNKSPYAKLLYLGQTLKQNIKNKTNEYIY